MKRFVIVMAVLTAGVAALVTACGGGGGSSTTSPSNGATVTYTIPIAPSNEVPPITNAEASISGTATITMHVTKDSSGNITAATADFSVNATGFPAGSTVTAAHIHPGGAGTNGGILVSTGLSTGDMNVSSGSGSFTKTGIPVAASDAQSIVNSPASYYFNIHTTLNPGGVARGQMGSGTVTDVPGAGSGTGY